MKELKEATITFRISEQEKAQLVQIAEDRDVTMSKLVRDVIKTFIQENEYGAI